MIAFTGDQVVIILQKLNKHTKSKKFDSIFFRNISLLYFNPSSSIFSLPLPESVNEKLMNKCL